MILLNLILLGPFITSEILFKCGICPSDHELNDLFSIFDKTVNSFCDV